MNPNGGTGSQVVGGFVALGMGVIAIAAIYQLSQGKAPLASDATKVGDNTLTAIFK
jgi:hypothetical protein